MKHYHYKIYATDLEQAIVNLKNLEKSQGADEYKGRSGTIYDVEGFKEIPFNKTTGNTNSIEGMMNELDIENKFSDDICKSKIKEVDPYKYAVGFKTGLSRQVPKRIVTSVNVEIPDKKEVKWKTEYKLTDKSGFPLDKIPLGTQFTKEETTFSNKKEAYQKAREIAVKEMKPIKVIIQKVIAEDGADELKTIVPNTTIIDVTEYQYIICGWAPSY